MWEQIRANKRKSVFLVLIMALLLFGIGYVFAEAYIPGGGLIGLVGAFVIWVVMSLSAYFQGDRILLHVSGAKKIEKSDHPQLFNVVEEMTIACGQPKPPDVYIMNDAALNAFAVGRNPKKAAVAVTSGLLGKLNRDELQGVIAHEMAHVVNRDVLLMTMVGVMLGAIVMISEIFLHSMLFSAVGGRSRRYSGSKNSGGGGGLLIVIAIVLAILAPILAQLIYLAVSRRREYLADASAAVFTRYPEGLASALEQIGGSTHPLRRANKATAPMFIANPFGKVNVGQLSSTHPAIQERVSILRKMGGSVSYGIYQKALGSVQGKRAEKLPKSAIREGKAGAARQAHPDVSKKKDARQQMREAGDLMRKVNQFLFLPCVCGMRIKLPPAYKKEQIECPRCQRMLAIPIVELGVMEQMTDAVTGGAQATPSSSPAAGTPEERTPLKVKRRGDGWMSFKCRCGATKSISPGLLTSQMQCSVCNRTIVIK